MKLLEKLDKDYGVFLLECGHTKRVNFVNYRNKIYKCQACFIERILKEANQVGLTCISENINGTRNEYQFIKCKHTISLTPQNVKNSKCNLRCRVCFDLELQNGANRNNIEILQSDSTLKSSTRLCLFKCCGLIKQTSIKSIINNTRCTHCYPTILNRKISLQSCLDVVETEVIKHDYRLFNLPCGHVKFMRIATAKKNLWICQECNSDVRSKQTNVYLLKITCGSFSWLKLGYAHNVQNRIMHYGLPKSRQVEQLFYLEFKSAFDALDFEKKIHAKYLSQKLDSNSMKKYMRKSGYTECYPLDIQEKLLIEFKKDNNDE